MDSTHCYYKVTSQSESPTENYFRIRKTLKKMETRLLLVFTLIKDLNLLLYYICLKKQKTFHIEETRKIYLKFPSTFEK